MEKENKKDWFKKRFNAWDYIVLLVLLLILVPSVLNAIIYWLNPQKENQQNILTSSVISIMVIYGLIRWNKKLVISVKEENKSNSKIEIGITIFVEVVIIVLILLRSFSVI